MEEPFTGFLCLQTLGLFVFWSEFPGGEKGIVTLGNFCVHEATGFFFKV